MYQPLNAKVDPPNYDFSLTTLDDFFPKKPVAPLEAKHGKPEIVGKTHGMRTLKFQVAQIRYKFPVLVQEKDGVINDFFARLPSYFLHDIFLQSLVKKFGKQKSYKRFGEEAYYVWEAEGFKHVYSAACTITCFPIFYAVESLQGGKTPLLKQMTSYR